MPVRGRTGTRYMYLYLYHAAPGQGKGAPWQDLEQGEG